jgi:predicted N-acyltransferase
MSQRYRHDPTARVASIVRSIHEVDRNQWNNVVTHADHGTMFHRHEWLAAVEAGYDHQPRHVVVTKDDNPVALMPNFVSAFTLPNEAANSLSSTLHLEVMDSGGVGHGGPIITSDERETFDRIFDSLEAATDHRLVYHRISTYDLGQIRYGQYLAARGYEPDANVATFFLDLTDGWESILAGMTKSRRKAVRRAHEQEYEVERMPLGDDLAETHQMYQQNIDRRDGTLVPRSFFDALDEQFPDRVRVFSAVVDGETVGRYVYLLDTENSVLHHWLSAIPGRECFDAYPSELLHCHAIKWGIEQGFERYCFGGTGSSFDNSVFRFKTQYGARAVPVLCWERGENPLVWPLFKYGRRKYVERDLRSKN